MSINLRPGLAALLAAVLSLTSVQAQQIRPTDDASRFQIIGTVTAINQQDHEILIQAEGMPEMQHHHPPLPFEVPDSIPMSRFHVGDRVSGDLVMSSSWVYVDNVVVLESADGNATPQRRKASPEPAPETSKPRNEIRKV